MADVCIVPSVYSEGFSRVVIEAASCGCYILASEYGALPEMIHRYKIGDTTGLNPWSIYSKLTDILLRIDLQKVQECIAQHSAIHFSERNAEVFL